MKLAVGWLLALALFASAASGSPGLERDPTRFHAFDLSRAASAERTSRCTLPRSPAVAFRVRVAAGIAHPPAPAPGGALLVAHETHGLSEYDAAGAVRWSAEAGVGRGAASPLVLADGTRLLITQAGQALSFSPRGRPLRRLELGLGDVDAARLVPAADGGVLVSAGREIARLDAAGSVLYRVRLDEEARGLFAEREPPLVVTRDGAVVALEPDGTPAARGGFGERVRSVERLDARRLLAVSELDRLVELDLSSRARRVWLSGAGSLAPSFAAGPPGEARLLTQDGILVAFDARGAERFRTSLWQRQQIRSGGELVLDARGSVLVAAPSVEASLVSADGVAVEIAGSACRDPLAPLVLCPEGAILACRSGDLVRLRTPR